MENIAQRPTSQTSPVEQSVDELQAVFESTHCPDSQTWLASQSAFVEQFGEDSAQKPATQASLDEHPVESTQGVGPALLVVVVVVVVVDVVEIGVKTGVGVVVEVSDGVVVGVDAVGVVDGGVGVLLGVLLEVVLRVLEVLEPLGVVLGVLMMGVLVRVVVGVALEAASEVKVPEVETIEEVLARQRPALIPPRPRAVRTKRVPGEIILRNATQCDSFLDRSDEPKLSGPVRTLSCLYSVCIHRISVHCTLIKITLPLA